MAVFNKSPNDSFETAFEQGVSTVKNTTKQAVKTFASDVMEQITGKVGNTNSNDNKNTGLKTLPPEQKQQVDDKQKKLLEETRMNLIELNKKIDEARKKRLQKEENKDKVEAQEKQKKAYVEEKKKKESIEMQNIKKSGATEILKGVSG